MSMIEDPTEYEAVSRLFDLVCEGNGNRFELELLDARIAKGLEQAYESEEPSPFAGMEFKRRATSLS